MDDQGGSGHEAAINDFKAMLKTCAYPAICGRDYILVAKLTEWLKSETRPLFGTTQVGRLLRAAYRDRNHVALPVSVGQIDHGHKCSLLVFSILLELGLGNLVHLWHWQGIVDTSLPIPLWSLKERIKKMDFLNFSLADVEQLAEKFNNMQWRFCPANFQLNDGEDYNKERIIPICRKDLINTKGGTAKLWQIVVQEEFVGKELREAVSSSRFKDPKGELGMVSQCTPPRGQLALITGVFIPLHINYWLVYSAINLP